MTVVPVRHPGRWVAAAVVVLLAAMLVHSLFFSTVERSGKKQERFEWHIINHYFFSSEVLQGLRVTIEITAIAMAGGIIIGVLLAIMRLSPNPIVSGAAGSTSGSFAALRSWCSSSSGTTPPTSFRAFTLGIPFGPGLRSSQPQHHPHRLYRGFLRAWRSTKGPICRRSSEPGSFPSTRARPTRPNRSA